MIVHLLNGNDHIRKRNTKGAEGVRILDCGCAHTDSMWLQMCVDHYDDFMDRHQKAKEIHCGSERNRLSATSDKGVA